MAQLLQCEDLLQFSVLHHCKLNIFVSWTVDWTEQLISRCLFRLTSFNNVWMLH